MTDMKETGILYGEAVIAAEEKKVIYVDETLCSILGYGQEELLHGDGVRHFFGEDYLVQIEDLMLKIMECGYAVTEYSVMTKSGREFLMLCHGTVFFNERGKRHLRLLFVPQGRTGKWKRQDMKQGIVKAETASLRYILDVMEEAVYIVSKDHYELLYCNDAFYSLRPRCTIGDVCYKKLHGREQPCEGCVIMKLLKENVKSTDKSYYDEEYKQSMNMSATTIKWDGEEAFLICIRNLKQTPEELERKRHRQRQAEHFAHIFKNNCDLITEIRIRTGEYNVMSREIDYPHAIAESGDYRQQEKILMEYVAFPSDREKIETILGYDNMLKAFENGANRLECRFRMFEDGKIRWKDVKAYYIKDETEPCIILTTLDITDKMYEEEATFSDRRNLLRAVSNIYFGIVYIDLTRGNFQILKTGHETPKALMEGDFSGYLDRLSERIHPADRKQLRDTFEREKLLRGIADGQGDFYCEVRELDTKGSYHHIRIEGVVLDEDTTDYTQMMLLVSDITKSKVNEEETKHALETAESINSAKTKILTRMSQEVYDSVDEIARHAERYLNDGMKKQDTDLYIKEVLDKARNICRDLGDILEIARMEAHNMVICEEDFTMPEMLYGIQEEVEEQAEKNGVAFRALVKGVNKEKYRADVVHLRQILMQLLSNAIKYSDAGGKVTLFVKQTEGTAQKDIFDFIVEDEGIGMEESVVNKMHVLFEKEQQADSRFVCGAGLSLTIVKNLVSLLGGSIRVRSARGQGTTFHINMEIQKAGAAPLQAPSPDEAVYGEGLAGKRILLVEDNRLNQDMAITLLELRDIRIECANHGKEAVDLFEMSEEGYYDLILMDAQMPFQNGYETAMALREMKRTDAKTVPIIAMLESRADYEVVRVSRSGMNDYIVKPLESQQLFNIIEKYC